LPSFKHATQRRHRPRQVLEDRKGVEVAVEDQAAARPTALDAADQALHPGRRLDDLDLDAGDFPQQRFGDGSDLLGVARRVGEATATSRRVTAIRRSSEASTCRRVRNANRSWPYRLISRRSHQRMPMASGQQITK
jgi:hypothetical protein